MNPRSAKLAASTFLIPCVHASCCAPGPSLRGHNDVRDSVLDCSRLSDSTAEPEVLGLIASAPGLRPADILTSALGGNTLTALDVGVASPHAVRAGEDCTVSMRRAKLRKYMPFTSDLCDAQVTYRTMICKHYNRITISWDLYNSFYKPFRFNIGINNIF